MKISVINESTQLKKSEFNRMVKACDYQLRKHACPNWETSISSVSVATKEIPKGNFIIAIMDDADQADALGYHSETPEGRPYGRVFTKPILQNGGSILDTANSVSCTLSHEVLEMWWDPQVNIWYEAKDGILWAGEICDPVEASSYPVYLGLQTIVQVSNFVLPPFFDAHPEKGVAFDFMGSLKKPFSLDKGGYAVTRTVRGKVSEIYGSRYSKWKLAGKKFPAARTARRK